MLVAEPSRTVQRVVEIALAPHAATLQLVATAEAALEALQAGGFDIILVDAAMQAQGVEARDLPDGYALCRRLRDAAKEPAPPVLLLTSREHPYDEARARHVGAAGHLTKPFGTDALVSAVQRLVGRSSSPPPHAPAASPSPPEAPGLFAAAARRDDDQKQTLAHLPLQLDDDDDALPPLPSWEIEAETPVDAVFGHAPSAQPAQPTPFAEQAPPLAAPSQQAHQPTGDAPPPAITSRKQTTGHITPAAAAGQDATSVASLLAQWARGPKGEVPQALQATLEHELRGILWEIVPPIVEQRVAEYLSLHPPRPDPMPTIAFEGPPPPARARKS